MRIELIKGDVTRIRADAIVNAANRTLLGGGGVDGAIHRVGGPEILEECKLIAARQGGCETGQAVFTTAGKLSAKYVIHTVGPVWNGGAQGEGMLLHSCYMNCLRIADELGVQTLAFPNISTGVYRFPKRRAAEIALASVREYASKGTGIETLICVCFDDENFEIYRELLDME